jgi:predicted anti-sigma-YlaC factor YlaD
MKEAPQSLVCERVRGQISLEVDGELSYLEQALVEAHIAHCADCRAYRADLLGFTGLLRSASLAQVSRPIALPQRSRMPIRASRLAAAAAAVLVAVLGGTIGTILSQKQQPRLQQRIQRPAVYDSPDYEMRLLRQARETTFWNRFARAL